MKYNWNSFFFLLIVSFVIIYSLHFEWPENQGVGVQVVDRPKHAELKMNFSKKFKFIFFFCSKSNSVLVLLNVVSWFWALGGSLINGRKRIGEMNTSFSRQTFFYF